MVLAIGQFRVSKYAQSATGADTGGVGIPGVGGVMPGVPDAAGNYNLVPGNVVPQTILPGGEVIPGVGGSPFLPGGVPMTPAYPGGPGPFWDPSTLPGRFGGRKKFGSRIVNVNVPKIVTAGQAFVIIVTYAHMGQQFGSYKLRVILPVFQITEITPEKKIMGQDSVAINLTAPSPLPVAPVTGTIELIQTEGNDITIDSEVITIPTEAVPNPPMPVPPPDETIPPPSMPPVAPPPPPVPLPPVLQQINLNITRGQDGGFEAIIIEASGLEPSEPTTVFIYLSQRKMDYREWRTDLQHRTQAIARATPAGSVATANVAYAYPVSVQGITGNGNGLRTNAMPNIPRAGNIQDLVNRKLRERLRMEPAGRVDQEIQRVARSLPEAQQLRSQIDSQVESTIQRIMANVGAGNASINQVIGSVTAPVIPPVPGPTPPVFKRQRISITASPEGTIRHVVRVREAAPGTPMFGFVVVYGHRSKKHSGRRQFSL